MGRTLVGVDNPLGFLEPSSEEEEDEVVWELKEEGSVSDLETERDFLDLKSFPGMMLPSFMAKTKIHPKREKGRKGE